MPARLRLAILLAAMAVVVQPAAAPRPTVAVATRAHRSPRDALTSLATAKARLDAYTRDEPSEALSNRPFFDAVAVGMAALVVACRRRLFRRLGTARAAFSPRNWVSVRGPPFAS